jgi:hypothetical protein
MGKEYKKWLRDKEDKEVTKVVIRADTVESFFDRARKAAQKADRGEPFKKSATFHLKTEKRR